MPTASDYIRAMRRDPTAWGELRKHNPNKFELQDIMGAFDTWYATQGGQLRGVVQPKVRGSVSQAFVDEMFKTWAKVKFGGR